MPKTLDEMRDFKMELLKKVFPTSALPGVYATAHKFAAGTTEAKARSLAPISVHENIVGVGYGIKVTDGVVQKTEAVKVYVRKKLPLSSLGQSAVPSKINGIDTDIVVAGTIRPQTAGTLAAVNPRTYMRPALCGVSIGHFAITAGTLGCLVKRRGISTQEQYILSNNHVIADSNAAVRGDLIIQPGTADGGNSTKSKYAIAHLTDFETIVFNGPANSIDAAIAKVDNLADCDPNIIQINRVANPPVKASMDLEVHKFGRTTDYTKGRVTDLSADIWVDYGDLGTSLPAWFEDQITIQSDDGNFSDGGDSGSLILTKAANNPVGLLFAGSSTGLTFANPIEWVLNHFNVEII